MNLLLLQLRNYTTFSGKTVCLGLNIDKTCVPNVFSESSLNTDTRIIRTLWHVPLVSEVPKLSRVSNFPKCSCFSEIMMEINTNYHTQIKSHHKVKWLRNSVS